MSDLEDDETPQLSAHALAALQEFYAEQKQQIDLGEDDKYNIGIIEENWQLSQFWYSQETALRLAQEAIAAVGEGGRVACVSAPSVYQKLRELCRENFTVYIFEYDKRFAMYGEEFIFYDYNNPLDLPERIAAHSFDIVIADPPYLSEECLRKTSETIKYLTRGKILLCTAHRVGRGLDGTREVQDELLTLLFPVTWGQCLHLSRPGLLTRSTNQPRSCRSSENPPRRLQCLFRKPQSL
ncbi:EEF1A lysine methyltransferase 1 isoform X2 [Macaca fascicularis]|uniref:EEF1A lysine methyltransferase 1 n=1 Tax=Macaca mulatta TaxID=9544 RepID=A0A5F7ZTV8_MACMU|nr:EEF1A lysine methyltransferase 1 isoform X2 [Macaca mulatta]XP_028693327.1 EEF1A lysine methyltransferase 1 isoform X2 [Macaca mulatta]